MTPDRPSGYDRLTPEDAAEIDAVCDRFEHAWREAESGGPIPELESYLQASQRGGDVLLEELSALDRACRERYSVGESRRGGQGLDAAPAEPDIECSMRARASSSPTVAAEPEFNQPRIPGLDLNEVLGAGGMGVVYKARQARLDRDVAVKVLREAGRADADRRDRFLREAKAIARLQHPHLVQVYEFGEAPATQGAEGRPYLVLEYVSGGSLVDLFRGLPQPPKEAALLVETLADAIEYAHQHGVIHRDLKPANVLLAGSSESAQEVAPRPGPHRQSQPFPKITDFGLAKFSTGGDLTRTGDMLGTPSYMAPEQTVGKSGIISFGVDVYGLGAILYEALTGRPPFRAENAIATIAQVRDEEPIPPRRLQPTVPRDLETICLKCLRKEPARRYVSARELAEDLRSFRTGESIRARPVGSFERVLVWGKRRPAISGMTAALVVVLFAGALGVLWQWRQANANATMARLHANAYLHERNAAQRQKARAERRLKLVGDQVDRLSRFGSELLQRPGQYRTGQAVLEEAIAIYQDMLPEDNSDPRVRREAAKLYGQLAEIHDGLGRHDRSAEAYSRRVALLESLSDENPKDQALLIGLADSNRWLANELRIIGKPKEAAVAYKRAAKLHDQLVHESPREPRYRVALANTLLNQANLLSRRDNAKELEALFERMMELYRSAVRDDPQSLTFQTELALGLESRGIVFFDLGREGEAEDSVREAMKVHEQLLNRKIDKGTISSYVARNLVTLARFHIAKGRTREAELSFERALGLLEQAVKESPQLTLCRVALARTLAAYAELLAGAGRNAETEALRQKAITHYERLKAAFPENPDYSRELLPCYLTLVQSLEASARTAESLELFRKAMALDPSDHLLNNNRAWFLAAGPVPRLYDAGLARNLARKAVAAKPDDGDYHNTLGAALMRAGDNPGAIAELHVSMNLRSGGDGLDWFFLAMAYHRTGDDENARLWLGRAVEWMDRNRPNDAELKRIRAEAEAILAAPRNL